MYRYSFTYHGKVQVQKLFHPLAQPSFTHPFTSLLYFVYPISTTTTLTDDPMGWIEGSIDDFDDILKAGRRRHGIARFIVLPMKPSLISPRAPRCLCNLQTILLGANIFLCQGKGKRNRQVLHPPGDKLFQWYFTTDFVCKCVTFIKTFINQPQWSW